MRGRAACQKFEKRAASMPKRRTVYARERARARFWTEHSETIRIVVIGGGMVLVVSLLAQMILR
jgi:hypothetical protein